VADLAPGPGATFYTRFGAWFGWLCVIAVAGLVGFGLRMKAA
jgi:apolipoprotein N-acyltransferase